MARIRTAAAADLSVVYRLLEREGLPTGDLAAARPQFLLLTEDAAVVAAGALERFGTTALLRSVVVAGDRRGAGLGRVIVGELENAASSVGINRLVLLTQTASKFFAAQGYQIIERSLAPTAVQRSEEFRSLCPSSATCMIKVLGKAE